MSLMTILLEAQSGLSPLGGAIGAGLAAIGAGRCNVVRACR